MKVIVMKKKIELSYIYFSLPLLFFLFIDFSKEKDIWFILAHGRYIFNNGFPHTEFLTFHEGMHFVMQQWGFSFISYILYHYIGSIGVICFIGILNLFLLFILYKLCFLISNNKYASCLVASLIDLLLQLNFIVPRPQVFSLLILLLVVYILERKDKSIYFLPLLSLLLINFHASMWLMLFILCMPFVCEYIIKKDKFIVKLIFMMIISAIVGFINPYGFEAMSYVFFSYGINVINKLVTEMHPVSLSGGNLIVYNSILFLITFIILVFSVVKNYKKHSIHSILLILGLSLMAFINLRSIALFMVCALPYIVYLFNIKIEYVTNFKYLIIIFFLGLSLFLYNFYDGKYKLRDDSMSEAVSYLNDNYNKNDMILYNDLDYGPYLEYNGYKVYLDTRVEVYVKKFNHKYDILDEYYDVVFGKIDYSKFINKYKFTHFVVYDKGYLFSYLKNNSSYKEVFTSRENFSIFERINDN